MQPQRPIPCKGWRMAARFFYDISSPYAYLAAHRVDAVLGDAVDWAPIAFGPLLVATKRVPWSLKPGREANMRDCERRAAALGLPPIRWAEGWPADSYSVDGARAALVGARHGKVREVTKALYAQVFAEGRRLDDPAILDAAGEQTGIPDLRAQAKEPATKQELRDATDEAMARGVVGIPTFEVGGELFWGDDRLDEAARAAAA